MENLSLIDDRDDLIISLYYLRSLNVYQASIILTEMGMYAEPKIMARSLADLMFIIKAIHTDKSIIEKLIGVYKLNKKRKLHNVIKYKEIDQNVDKRQIDNIIKDIDIEMKKCGATKLKISPFKLANISGLNLFYDFVYTELSEAVHGTINDLDCYLDNNIINNIENIFHGPNERNVPELLVIISNVLIIITGAFLDYFDIKKAKDFDLLQNRFRNLDRKYADLEKVKNN